MKFKIFIIFIINCWEIFNLINAYNISPKPNLIIKEPSLITYMPKTQSSYFGYTINLRSGSIIIGAPRAQSTLESQMRINETGAIYRYTFQAGNCEPYIFDRYGNHHTKNDEYTWSAERKDFQWLGGSMDGGSRDNEPLFVCAPRLRDDAIHEYLIHGICYWTPDTLSDQPRNIKTIAPLRLKNLQTREKQSKSFFYMYGEQGISIHWTGKGEETIIGAPGIHTWKGSVLLYKLKIQEDMGGLSKRDTESKRIRRQSTMEYVTEIPDPELWKQQDDSYFGYSVSSGRFDNTNISKILYVASAPQADRQSGEVYIFDTILDRRVSGRLSIMKHKTFHGNQFGEFFGYSVISEDINGDGLADLIVSAPMHSVDMSYDKGAVYIFINKGNFYFEKQLIVSPSDLPGRFGSTISKLGDINRDGFNDLAIGAPFQQNGSVYIYLGAKNGLREKPSQILNVTSTHYLNKDMFGHGLSRGVDIDLNGFNDLVVGAPNSDTVYLYKTYPVVKIIGTIGSTSRELKMDQNKFQIKACFRIQTTSQRVSSQDLIIKIKADPQVKRVKFSDGSNEQKFSERALTTDQCKLYDANVKYNAKDVFKPIELEIHYELANKIPDTEKFCEHCVAVDPSDPILTREKIIFSTGCKSEICIADLKLSSSGLSSSFVLGSSRTLAVQYDIFNRGETAFLPQINITSSNKMPFAKIPSSCNSNNGFVLVCDLFKGRPMLNNDKESLNIVFDTSNVEGTQMIITAEAFSAGKEFDQSDNILANTIHLKEFSTLEAIGSSDKIIISLEEQSGFVDFVNEFEIKNFGPSQVKEMVIALSIPVSYLLPNSRNRISLIDFHNLNITGEYSSHRLKLEFYQNNLLILQNHSGKQVSYPENTEGMNFDSSNVGYPIEENPFDDDQQFLNSMSRRKRSASSDASDAEYAKISERNIEKSISEELMGTLPLNRTISFNCNDPDETLCVKAVFKVYNFKSNENEPVSISLRFKVNLDEINKILIGDKEFFVITTGLNISKVGDEEGNSIRVEKSVPHNIISKHQLYTTPIWIIIVSVLAGILLLVLLTYGLYRLGFFKRTKKEEMAQLTRESQREADETEDED